MNTLGIITSETIIHLCMQNDIVFVDYSTWCSLLLQETDRSKTRHVCKAYTARHSSPPATAPCCAACWMAAPSSICNPACTERPGVLVPPSRGAANGITSVAPGGTCRIPGWKPISGQISNYCFFLIIYFYLYIA